MRAHEAQPWVRDFVLAELRFAEAPIKRDALTETTMQQAAAAGYGWKRSTVARSGAWKARWIRPVAGECGVTPLT